MSFDIGSTVEGTVIKLAEYGAIVRLQGGQIGLIHVSEIADTFVRDVTDHFKEQDRVRVRVLRINNKGRYELSVKQIEQPVREAPAPPEPRKPLERIREPIYLGPDHPIDTITPPAYINFEDQVSRFLRDSQERLGDLKRNLELKRCANRKR